MVVVAVAWSVVVVCQPVTRAEGSTAKTGQSGDKSSPQVKTNAPANEIVPLEVPGPAEPAVIVPPEPMTYVPLMPSATPSAEAGVPLGQPLRPRRQTPYQPQTLISTSAPPVMFNGRPAVQTVPLTPGAGPTAQGLVNSALVHGQITVWVPQPQDPRRLAISTNQVDRAAGPLTNAWPQRADDPNPTGAPATNRNQWHRKDWLLRDLNYKWR